MRQILLMRGIPGSGKSTWLRKHNLTPYTICPDDIRLLFSSPIMDRTGHLSINGSNDKRVWELVYSTIEERMDKGDFIVVDATHKKISDLNKYVKLANKYFYKVGCVDFTDVPLETCLEQNAKREEYKRVPEQVIKDNHALVQQHKVPNTITVLDPNNEHALVSWTSEAFKYYNLNSFKKIHHIGDIQGCFEPIKEYFKDGFKDDEYYIFTGDFLDRGIQNGLVLEWAIANLIDRDNVVLMMGNHERHLLRWIGELPAKGLEFSVNTLPQIQHIKKADVYKLLSKLQDCFVYNYGDKQVIVSHGGIGKIPNLNLLPYIPGKTFWNGAGVYRDPIDEDFERENPDWTQIHGHRNKSYLPIQPSKNSYNLEGKVEFGGHLRIVTFELNHPVKIETIEIHNTVHKTNEECLRDY